MKRNFTNENFEEFLRQSAGNLQMRPSAKVWQGISEHFNRRRRTGIVIAVSLLVTTALSYYFVSDSHPLQSSTEQVAKTQFAKQPVVEQSTSHHLAVSSSTNNKTKPVKKISKTNLIAASSQHTTLHSLASASDASVVSENNFMPTVVDSNDENPLIQNAASVSETEPTNPLTIESVFNSYEPAHKSKLGFQFYFAPTINFRRVNDNMIEKIVMEKPNFGFEAGFAAKYPVAKNLKFKAGLQFNINSYSVKTFDTYTQTATIRVNDQNGTAYNSLTNYNNFSGYQSKWLQNYYFQVSAPVGIELKLKGDNTTQFGIASTLQPTYLLGNKAYLISTDYKNYAMFPNLIRHWNISTSLETYVGYSTGHLKWQVGPQVRYQLLSSYVKKYSVKENLFGFGLKVGVSLNNR